MAFSLRLQAGSAPWTMLGADGRSRGLLEALSAAAGLLALGWGWVLMPMTDNATSSRASVRTDDVSFQQDRGRETLAAFYAGHPWYYRTDVRLTRPGGTDMVLKDMGWDGDAFYFPLDGGVRGLRWSGNVGGMIDFYHSKAIARLGRGAHGRKLSNPVVETVKTEGTLKGQPAPAELKLTDMFERLEFTHGHNVLLATGVARLSGFGSVQPYAGLGIGFALPHTEVRFVGESQRTSEYQFGGPAAQGLFGLELRRGNISYFLEYKFIYAGIEAQITGDTSWMNWDMVGDLYRQTRRWVRGEEPQHGRISTRLSSHNVFIGVGYWLKGRPAATP